MIEDKPVVLYGAGRYAAARHNKDTNLFVDVLHWRSQNNVFKLTPICFCDTDKEKIGSEYLGLHVYGFEQLREKYGDEFNIYIATSRNYSKEIMDRLLDLGVSLDRILNPVEDEDWQKKNDSSTEKGDPRSDSRIYKNGNILPLYSGNRNSALKGIFFKPSVKPLSALPSIVEHCKMVDADNFSKQIHRFTENRDLFTHEFAYYADKDPYPIPLGCDREDYDSANHIQHWCNGFVQFIAMMKLYSTLSRVKGDLTYLDLGCASGRVLRHALTQPQCPMRIIGCDMNARHIDWMRHYLPGKLEIFQNTILPSMPLEDNTCDIVSGFSVFTHIDDLEFAWLMEMRRILKPGGIAFFTVMSDMLWDRIGSDPAYDWAFTNLIANKYQTPYKWLRENFPTKMPEKRVVLYHPESPIYNCDVYHHCDYIRKEWGRFFEVIDILPAYMGLQDMVVLRKKIEKRKL